MSNPAPQLVQKLWNYCNILRDDGLSYGDYVEQLTFLLFLKMADEQSLPPFNKPSSIPKGEDRTGFGPIFNAKRRFWGRSVFLLPATIASTQKVD
jgi:type I restriction-modification system DNA methylase subunit